MKNKLVAVLNKGVEPGKVMNALAHMCIGFGAKIGPDPLELIDYIDAEGNTYPNISRMPFIILRANSNKIRRLKEDAELHSIPFSLFTHTMTEGSWDEQLERTANTQEDALECFGIVLFGPNETLKDLTKKFSLWK